MERIELKIRELEMKLEELEILQENIHETVKNQLDNNDVRTLLEQVLAEKRFATHSDMEQRISASQIQLIKWIMGTGISTVSIIIALM